MFVGLFWCLIVAICVDFSSASSNITVSSNITTQATPACPEPTPPNNGTVMKWGNNLLVEYVCDDGLFPIGRTFGSCDLNRKRWSIKTPTCVSSDCEHPGNVTNGRLYFTHSDAVVTTVCDAGYKLVGTRRRFCDGYQWIGFSTKCRDKYPSSKVKQQTVSEDSGGESSSANSYQEAVEDGDSTCTRHYKAPPTIENGTFSIGYGYNKGRRQWVMVANYTCSAGFRLKNPDGFYRYCKSYKWKTPIEPECEQGEAPAVDLCKDKNGGCSQICVPHPGGRRYNCDCLPGFILMDNYKSCQDVNECWYDNGGCEHWCHNLLGSYFCTCKTGYVLSGHRCLDEDECSSTDRHRCAHGCINVPGSYVCNCSVPGYAEGRDPRSCVDVNECDEDNGGCEHLCINSRGSHKCKCKKGYVLAADNRTCEDVDECLDSKTMKCKGGTCVNTVGSFSCECGEGYKLKRSKRRCVDIDECLMSTTHMCDQTCVNTDGGYICDCYPGYALTNFSTCAPCPRGYYRSTEESECTSCPTNATTAGIETKDITGCECLPGFHGNVTAGEDCVEDQMDDVFEKSTSWSTIANSSDRTVQ